MKNILTKIHIHPFTYIVFLISLITGLYKELCTFLFIIVIHELGHITGALIFRWKIDRVNIMPFGAITIFEEKLNRPMIEEFIILIMGPLFQFINYLIFKDKRFKKEKCENIRVGNILKIYKDDLIPADVLIIKSSLKSGLAYMQTSNLDGENTLKPREALNITQTRINNKLQNLKKTFDYTNDHFLIEVIDPNKNIYDIEGTVIFDHKKNHINIKNVLLRGSRLKNVDYVYGIVIYNGHDTKLMQNIEHSSNKLSTIDVKLNFIVIIIFIAFLLMNIISDVIGIKSREEKLPNYDNQEIKSDYLFYYNKTNPGHALEITRIISNNFLTASLNL